MWLVQYFSSRSKNPHVGIRNFGEIVKGRIYRGADCGTVEYLKLKKLYAVELRVCLFDDVEKLHQDRYEAERAGLEWEAVPMSDRKKPTAEQVMRALALLRSGKRIFLGCRGARHRASLIAAVFAVCDLGWTKEEAWRGHAEAFGYYSALGHGALKIWFFRISILMTLQNSGLKIKYRYADSRGFIRRRRRFQSWRNRRRNATDMERRE